MPRSIQFHTAVVDLFRSSMQQNPKQTLGSDYFGAEVRTVEHVCLASMNQLKHLVLVFRTRYSCASTCFLWHNALLYVANDCVYNEPSFPEDGAIEEDMDTKQPNSDLVRRITWFMACVDGYKALAPQFPIVGGIMQGLLSMGIENGLVTAAGGRAYMAEAKVDASMQVLVTPPEKLWMTAQNFSTRSRLPDNQDNFIIDLNGALADPIAASIDALSHRFNQITMLDELPDKIDATSPV